MTKMTYLVGFHMQKYFFLLFLTGSFFALVSSKLVLGFSTPNRSIKDLVKVRKASSTPSPDLADVSTYSNYEQILYIHHIVLLCVHSGLSWFQQGFE